MGLRRVLYGFLLFLPARASPANQYVAGEVCASCHPGEARAQGASEHAFALRRTGDHPLAKSFFQESTKSRPPGYRFDFLAGGTVRISDSSAVAETPLEWAFGAGQQAVTFVSRVDTSHYVEFFYSYYRALDRLGPTPGQQELHPAGLGEAAGLYYKTRDPAAGIDGCFRCHSTGPLEFKAGDTIQPSESGVHCEACHGPGAAHVTAARSHRPAARLIGNPARLSASDQLKLCGECHRPPQSNAGPMDWSFAWNVRHQPVYLAQSACFRLSKGALSCTTCHAAHERLEVAAQSYNRQCLRCHARQAKACASNCIDCHMPSVSPQAPLRFTNHWIGVFDSGAKLVPRRRS